MNLRPLYITLIFWFISWTSFAQKLNTRKFSIKEGLIESTVKQIEQDSYGNLWLATNNGLAKFNGKSFENFNTSNGLPSNEVSALLFANDVLYIGTKKGFCSFNGNKIEKNPLYKKIHGSTKKILYNKGDLHVITTEGYFILTVDKPELTVDSVSIGNIISKIPTDAEFDEDGNLWISTTRGGLFFIETTMMSTKIPKFVLIQNSSSATSVKNKRVRTANFNSSNVLKSESIACIEFDKNKNLLLSDWNNGVAVIKFDFINNSGFSANYMEFTSNQDQRTKINRIVNIQKDEEGNLYLATDGFGFIKVPLDANINENDFSPQGITWLSSKEGFFGNNPLCIKQDQYKNIWAGTLYDGLILISNKSALKYNQSSGLEEEKVISVFKSSDNSIWVGTYGGGAFKFKDKMFTRCFWDQGISESIIKSITEDIYGNIWLGSMGGGISIINKENADNNKHLVAKTLQESNGLSSNHVAFLYKSKSGAIWVGYTMQNKIDKISINKDLTVTIKSYPITKLTTFNVSCIAEDELQNIWITANEGVWMLNPKTENINSDYDYFKNIQTISKDWNGNMWLGSSDAGAIILKNSLPIRYFENGPIDSPEKITALKGISSDCINTILFAKGTAWFVSNNGINEIKIDTYVNKIKEIKVYNKGLGFASYDNKPNTAIVDNEGFIWIGSVEGLTQFKNLTDNETTTSKKSTVVFINSISIDNKVINWANDTLFSSGEYESIKFDGFFNWYKVPKNLELDYTHNTIKFTLNTDNIAEQDQINYTYKLVGFDKKEWKLLDKNTNEITYGNLPSGDYSLIVKASLGNDFSNATEYHYSFSINPPIWETKTFYVLAVLFSLGLLYFFILTRERRLKKEKEKLEQEVRSRTSEIENKKQEIEVQNALIQGINNDLTDSIKYAQRIQQTILPNTKNWLNYFSDFFLYYKPRNIVSGDYYWMKELNDLIYIAVVDCTGHGVPGAFMSLITSSILNEAVDPNISKNKPVKILRYLRKEINARLSLNNGEHINDGLDIALICYDKENSTVEYVNANRPMYVISNNELVTIPSEKVTIGGYADFVSMIPSKVIPVKKGDSLFLFTDGLTDQFGGPKNKKYNPARLRQFLLDNNHLELSQIRDNLEKDLLQWQGSYEQTDDILLIGLKI